MNLSQLLDKRPLHFLALLSAIFLALVTTAAVADNRDDGNAPLIITKEGNFFVGGQHNASDQIVGQMYVEYQIPQKQTQKYPIILVHGGGQLGVGWWHTPDGREGWAQYFLRRGYAVYLPDRRGSGRSEEPRGDFRNPAQLVDDVGSFVDLARREHPEEPVFLVGGCWGARPAVTFALEAQDDLAGLVLVCPALKAKVTVSPGEKVKVFAGRLVAPSAPIRIPLSPELFTRNERWLEFIRNDPLALQTVTARFFFEHCRSQELGLPRVFRTTELVLFHAASCRFRYSSRASCGVR